MRRKEICEGKLIYSENGICGSEIFIKGFQRDEETQAYEVEIAFLDVVGQRMVSAVIERDKLSAKFLQNLMTKMGGINNDAKKMLEHFYKKEREALNVSKKSITYNGKMPIKFDEASPELITAKAALKKVHKVVGWKMTEGGLKFFANSIISGDIAEDSTYTGDLKIQTRGSFGDYIEFVKNYVIGNVALESVLAIGASATVLGFANMVWETNIYNPIVHIYGTSSTGKTTVAKLVASLGGCPEKGRGESLFLTFNGTLNAIMKKIGKNQGYTVIIDELSLVRKKDVSQFVYALAEGTDKERLGRMGEKLQCNTQFMSTILTNGECSLLGKCNGNEGLRARVFEFDSIAWTKSAEDADNIKRISEENYGFVTPLIAQKLLESSDKWRLKMEEWRKTFMYKARREGVVIGITERVVKTLALFMVSADILEEVLDIEMEKNEMFEFFFSNIILKVAEDANIGIRAYKWIRDYFIKNKANFPVKEWHYWGDIVCPASADGTILTMKSPEEMEIVEDGEQKKVILDRTICLTETQADEILVKGGFSDTKVCMKALKDLGLLLTINKNTSYARFTVNNEECKGYRIKIPQEACDFQSIYV